MEVENQSRNDDILWNHLHSLFKVEVGAQKKNVRKFSKDARNTINLKLEARYLSKMTVA